MRAARLSPSARESRAIDVWAQAVASAGQDRDVACDAMRLLVGTVLVKGVRPSWCTGSIQVHDDDRARVLHGLCCGPESNKTYQVSAIDAILAHTHSQGSQDATAAVLASNWNIAACGKTSSAIVVNIIARSMSPETHAIMDGPSWAAPMMTLASYAQETIAKQRSVLETTCLRHDGQELAYWTNPAVACATLSAFRRTDHHLHQTALRIVGHSSINRIANEHYGAILDIAHDAKDQHIDGAVIESAMPFQVLPLSGRLAARSSVPIVPSEIWLLDAPGRSPAPFARIMSLADGRCLRTGPFITNLTDTVAPRSDDVLAARSRCADRHDLLYMPLAHNDQQRMDDATRRDILTITRGSGLDDGALASLFLPGAMDGDPGCAAWIAAIAETPG